MGAIIGDETLGFRNYIANCTQNDNNNELEAIAHKTF